MSYLKDESPDVLCIQETKCAEADIPDDVHIEGYKDYWSSAEQAGYAGTAIYSKTEPVSVKYGLGNGVCIFFSLFSTCLNTLIPTILFLRSDFGSWT